LVVLQSEGVGRDKSHSGMPFQYFDLPLQFTRQPLVVRVQKGYMVALSEPQSCIAHNSRKPGMFTIYVADLGAIALYKLAGLIGGSIVNQDNLKILKRLQHDAVQRVF
jgi:hypothetical protein